MTNDVKLLKPLPADWPQFWAHVQAALGYADRRRRPRRKMRRFVREMKRRIGNDPRYQDPRDVAYLIERIWAERPEVRQIGKIR